MFTSKMKPLLCFVLGLLSLLAYADAYRVQASGNMSDAFTCNQFITKLGDGFQMRALSLQNSSDEWFTASDVSQKCDNTLEPNYGSFEVYMVKLPTRISFKIEIRREVPLSNKMRLNVLATWGDLSDVVRVLCDYHGNAYFVNPGPFTGTGGFLGTGLFFPQKLSAQDYPSNISSLVFSDSFDVRLTGLQESSPVFGEGFAINPVLCPIQPSTANSSQHVWAPSEISYDVTFSAEIRYWWGLLHPEMWSELILLAVIAFPKLILVLWFLYRYRQFRDHVMTQQKYFLAVSSLSFVASTVFLLFLVGANGTGADTCCPTPPGAALLLGIKVMTNMAFDLLVLATAKGWGVVTPRLEAHDQRKIIAYFVASLIIFMMSQILRPSLSIAWLVVLNETLIWVWIFVCLRHTKTDLKLSSRLDRHAKLEMYEKLHRLLLVGLGMWCFIVTVELWIVIVIFNREGRIALFDFPPTLAWDMSFLVMMWGFGIIWRPSPATAQFSYAFARQEEEGFDARDPVSEFGLEESE